MAKQKASNETVSSGAQAQISNPLGGMPPTKELPEIIKANSPSSRKRAPGSFCPQSGK